MKGIVKKLMSDKGFGFIKGDDGVDYFVHQSSCLGRCFPDLTVGCSVTFEPEEGTKGPRAEDVEKQ